MEFNWLRTYLWSMRMLASLEERGRRLRYKVRVRRTLAVSLDIDPSWSLRKGSDRPGIFAPENWRGKAEMPGVGIGGAVEIGDRNSTDMVDTSVGVYLPSSRVKPRQGLWVSRCELSLQSSGWLTGLVTQMGYTSRYRITDSPLLLIPRDNLCFIAHSSNELCYYGY